LTLRKKLGTALTFVNVLAYAGSAFAVPSYSITNAPSEVNFGEMFTVDVTLNLGVDGVGNPIESVGHEVSVDFSPGLLVAVGAVELGVPPYQLNLSPGVRGIDNATGIVDQFEAAAFTPITFDEMLTECVGSPAACVLGQITFQAGDVGVATIIGFFSPGAAVLDATGQAIDGVVFNSVSVNVVIPTPTPIATPTPPATSTPTATPTPTPTATPTPMPLPALSWMARSLVLLAMLVTGWRVATASRRATTRGKKV
jgi:hypothetical protein